MPKVGQKLVKKRPTAVGVYVFAGGFTIGVKAVGFDVSHHFEDDPPYGATIVKKNLPDIEIHAGFDNWPRLTGVDFVYGNPPCAAWSQAGSANKAGKSWRDSSLVDCTRRHFSLLDLMRPRVWAWESVQRAWTLGRELVDELASKAAKIGYSTTIWLHDAVNLGVPQKRPRFFMVCHDVELDFKDRYDPPITVEMALRGVDRGEPLEKFLNSMSRDVIEQMNTGENLRSAWERWRGNRPVNLNSRGQVKGRPSFSYIRPRPDAPSQVVRQEMIHPTENRGMSENEIKTLCGFPKSYSFDGRKDAPYLIGRGVCPPVAKHLAQIVSDGIASGKSITIPFYRVVNQTKSPTTTLLIKEMSDA